jgi:hypothetical protein
MADRQRLLNRRAVDLLDTDREPGIVTPAREQHLFLARLVWLASCNRPDVPVGLVHIERRDGLAHKLEHNGNNSELQGEEGDLPYVQRLSIGGLDRLFHGGFRQPRNQHQDARRDLGRRARADIKMIDMVPIVRCVDCLPGNYLAVGDLVNRRWSWPGIRAQSVISGPKPSTERCPISRRTAASSWPMASTNYRSRRRQAEVARQVAVDDSRPSRVLHRGYLAV